MIAINPFKAVQLYESNHVDAYRQKLANSPHVFAIADAAYDEMMRGLMFLLTISMKFDLLLTVIFVFMLFIFIFLQMV